MPRSVWMRCCCAPRTMCCARPAPWPTWLFGHVRAGARGGGHRRQVGRAVAVAAECAGVAAASALREQLRRLRPPLAEPAGPLPGPARAQDRVGHRLPGHRHGRHAVVTDTWTGPPTRLDEKLEEWARSNFDEEPGDFLHL